MSLERLKEWTCGLRMEEGFGVTAKQPLATCPGAV